MSHSKKNDNNPAALPSSSTNPFDSFEEDDDLLIKEDVDNNNNKSFGNEFDQLNSSGRKANIGNATKTNKRLPHLDFSLNSYDKLAAPALNFDNIERPGAEEYFSSPLESALLGSANHTEGVSRFDDTDSIAMIAGESDPLLGTSIGIGATGIGTSRRNKLGVVGPSTKWSSTIPKAGAHHHHHHHTTGRSTTSAPSSAAGKMVSSSSLVLKHLNPKEEREKFVDYKMIRLEDLGTASSWIILLLPYFAFLICILLEYYSGLKITTLGPIDAASSCVTTAAAASATSSLAGTRIPSSCHFANDSSFSPANHNNGRATLFPNHGSNNSINGDQDFKTATATFEAGPISNVPSSSTFIYGDATFKGLSTHTVATIAKGLVMSSAIVLQKQQGRSDSNDEDWTTLALVKPSRLSMACHLEEDNENNNNNNELISGNNDNNKDDDEPMLTPTSTWTCTRPRIIDLLFSMPGTTILSGDDIGFKIVFSSFHTSSSSFVYGDDVIASLIMDSNTSSSSSSLDVVVNELVKSSSYTIEYPNPVSAKADIVVRLFAFGITLLFTVFWLYKLGTKGLCLCCCCRLGGIESSDDSPVEIKNSLLWLESPWIQFPERWYILLLLLSLILIQGPFPVIMMYISPRWKQNFYLHALADVMLGVGVNGVLFVYLCLFQGFRYHTATVTRKLQLHQRKVRDLRRAAKYVISGEQEEAIGIQRQQQQEQQQVSVSQYLDEYFERHGDIDGSTMTGHLRFRHDPFGDSWADFLIPKLLVFLAGVLSCVVTACTKFPPTGSDTRTTMKSSLDNSNDNGNGSDDLMSLWDTLYVISSSSQFLVTILWIAMIGWSVCVTGQRLKNQPFLSSRPAQLAYRILFAHATLGFGAVLVSFGADLDRLFKKWTAGGGSGRDGSAMLRVIAQAKQQFPYYATAVSIDFGRIVFATVTILITAFIFLPPIVLQDNNRDDDNDNNNTTHEDRYHHGSNNLIETERQRRDKRRVVTLAKYTHTWRVFPLPIMRNSGVVSNNSTISDHCFTNGYHAIVSVGNYIPVFCVEIACWLHEASVQAYYSPTSSSQHSSWSSDSLPGRMNLNSIGLKLETAILDETTSTQVYISSNIAPQVDGETDSIIVISFRGSVDAANIRTDLKSRQVPLIDQLLGIDIASFRVTPDGVTFHDTNDWIWDTSSSTNENSSKVKCFSPSSSNTSCLPFHSDCSSNGSKLTPKNSTKTFLLGGTPLARDTVTVPYVHEGFQEVYTHLRKKVIESVLPVLQRQLARAVNAAKPDNFSSRSGAGETTFLPKIYITGHSLGGSLAQLLALDLSNNCELVLKSNPHDLLDRRPEHDIFELPRNISTSFDSPQSENHFSFTQEVSLQPAICVYTFGQPRVGNLAFSRFYKQRVPHTFRVSTEGDPITAMPNFAFCSGVYKHAGLQVVLDEGKTGNTLVGPTVVETLFRFHKVGTNLAAHSTDCYRDSLESALAEHELREYYKGHSGSNISGIPEGGGLLDGSMKSSSKHYQEVPEWMTQFRSAHYESI